MCQFSFFRTSGLRSAVLVHARGWKPRDLAGSLKRAEGGGSLVGSLVALARALHVLARDRPPSRPDEAIENRIHAAAEEYHEGGSAAALDSPGVPQAELVQVA